MIVLNNSFFSGLGAVVGFPVLDCDLCFFVLASASRFEGFVLTENAEIAGSFFRLWRLGTIILRRAKPGNGQDSCFCCETFLPDASSSYACLQFVHQLLLKKSCENREKD